jgi:pyruvate/2-oxoacid:ferredoxin oxidoreductase alpha subunit
MQEFLGLAYFAEIPAVLFNVQRGGPRPACRRAPSNPT